MHPAYFTYPQIRDWSAAEPPGVLAVLGDPVAHSLSPQLHTPALRACGIAGDYIRLEVKEAEFGEALRRMLDLGFIGANVTIPHKFTALRTVDQVSDQARQLGAVNTLLFRNGRIEGQNSDGPGFVRAIKEAFGQKIRDLRILIIGAGGGAGRAVAVQCALEQCQQLVLVNRSLEKLVSLQKQALEILPGGHVTSIPHDQASLEKALPQVDLVINATNLGMKPGDAPVLAGASLDARHLAYDMVYRPHETAFLKQARTIGASASNGLGMLLHQGAVSFEWWFDRAAPLEAMRAGLLAAVQAG